MPGETALKASRHGNTRVCPTGSDEEEDEKQKHTPHMSAQAGTGLYLLPTEALYLDRDRLAQDDMKEDSREWMSLADLSQDDASCLEGCVQLERRWVLWHEFMKEYSCLDDWLQLAEKLAASPNSSHVLYITAKEELQKFEHFVLQREDFERQREEMAVWLADMDLRLTEVEHFSERNTCAKMRQLQGFQQAVAECAGRLNALLEQGEKLIQRSEPADAQAIEGQLQELLLYCARVFQGLGRLHTRLLSMRLVFEEDWPLCPDSGCPSETMLEEEATGDPTPPALNGPALHCHEQLVLEWDPSVDIGGSISHDDTDSSYFSANAGLYSAAELLTKDPLRRRAYLSPSDSQKATACVQQPVTERSLQDVTPPRTPLPDTGRPWCGGLWKTSTPDPRSSEPVTFDPERISAWLGQTHRLCSKAVQTEDALQQCSSFTSPSAQEREEEEVGGVEYLENALPKRSPCPTHTQNMCSTQSCDLQHHSGKLLHSNPQCLKRLCSSDSVEGSSRAKTHCTPCGEVASADRPQRSFHVMDVLRAPAVLYILLALLLVVVIWPHAVIQDNQCHRSNTLERSFHFALRYVNGPPPT
ncbi:uncharacterized protein [Salminus brasiliensis]|uniref:uncharacterized protein isoform X2 n=1 Tax=Salminus brasiliensis TaxID=930266 RepID=UPI003B82E6FD